MRNIFIITLLIICTFQSYAAPKRELRAVWIATVGNIDWPSKMGLSSHQQKTEFIQRLDFLQSLGFNTIIVQVRPAADALYESSYEPWSRYLSGKQGEAPFPKYDPLAFMVEEAHKRNMDIHAWFNPYRALVSSKSNPNPPHHPTKKNPDWIIHYDGKAYFDPGNPQAREYIIKVMLEAVSKYDIDALHIDDYFYPYPVKGLTFNDQATYNLYGQGLSLADWRRKNVNTFISQLSTNIKKIKPHVKFGVSPFGIWRNQKTDPEGSATNGTSCYDDLYSDVRLWTKQKWVDYMAPQLYWERGHRVADYNALLPWWVQNQHNRGLYIGLGLYRMVNAKSGIWSSPNEILAQINAARAAKTDGVVLYSLSSFDKIPMAIRDSLKKETYFGNVSIPPAMPWIDSKAPAAPKVLIRKVGSKVTLTWTMDDGQGKEPLKYLVYRFKVGAPIQLGDNEAIRILTKNQSFSEEIPLQQGYQYVVTALDRLWNESIPSEIVIAQ